MATIEEIPGINGATLDLFRAAGLLNSGDLAALSTEELMNRLDEANAREMMLARLPAVSAVDAWRGAAKVLEGGRGGARAQLPSNVMKDVRAPGLPTARQMSSQQLREAGIPATQVPIGKLLAEVSSEMEAERASRSAQVREETPARKDKPARVVEDEEVKAAPSTANAEPGRTTETRRAADGKRNVRELGVAREHPEREEFSPIGESKPAQRRLEKRNHGMLHRDPGSVYLGALATVLAMILAAVGFVAVGVALVYALYYGASPPLQTLWVLSAFPVALVLHVTLGLRPRCRLCGQQLFRPKACNKHVKSHRSPFGHIFAVALHAVTRRWFRCMLCGTKQRLHE